MTVHDIFVITHPEWYSARYVRVHRPLLRRHLRTAAGVVCSSPTVADELNKSGLVRSSTPVVVAPCATVDLTPGRLPESLQDLEGAKYFLSVASHEPRKNADRLVRAYAALPATFREAHPLVMVGGTHAAFAGVEGPTEVAGLRRLGYVDDSTLAALYRPEAVLVSVSLAEGFGLPVIESALGQTGLLLSDIPVYRWLAGEDATYADPFDESSIAAALEAAASRPRQDRQVARNDRFSWSGSASIISTLMSQLATG